MTTLSGAGRLVMPAEWGPQETIWLAWPHNEETWPGDALSHVRDSYVQAVGHLVEGQPVSVLVADEEVEEDVRQCLRRDGSNAAGVRFVHVPTCDSWIRDYGPTFVVDRVSGGVSLVSWRFNAWGGKYPEFFPDDDVPGALATHLGLPVLEPGIVMEGGSIDVNGRGLLMTTEQCLLNANRNPGLGREDIESCLARYLGITETLWLGEGIVGDDTDGHVDDIARFVGPDSVVCVREPDPEDENHAVLEDNYERLMAFRDASGRGLRVVSLPMPSPVCFDGNRLPASYANFCIANRTVLVPVFQDARDGDALAVLRRCFPGRDVVGIDCRVMVRGLGTLHCCSQQQPVSGIGTE